MVPGLPRRWWKPGSGRDLHPPHRLLILHRAHARQRRVSTLPIVPHLDPREQRQRLVMPARASSARKCTAAWWRLERCARL